MTLVGQSKAETMLARAIAHARVGHAYLFLGPTGSGKSTAARLFAQAMNCDAQPAVREPAAASPHEGAAGRWRLAPCGRCQSCLRIAADTHPEVIEVHPGSKTGQNITVEQAREIRKNASLRPKLGQRRVYLIPRAETFNDESANALLKTLEEPSSAVTLILCAPSPSQVLPTIRSRCQIVRFGVSPPEEIEVALTTGGTTPEIARALSRACGGRPGLAFSWAREPAVLKQRRQVLDLFSRAMSLQREARRDPAVGATSLRLAEQLRGLAGTGKEDEEGPARPAKALHADNLETGLTFLRDLVLLAQGAPDLLVQNQDRLPELHDLVRFATPQRLLDDIHAVREAQQILERNVQPQLVLERMFWTLISGR